LADSDNSSITDGIEHDTKFFFIIVIDRDSAIFTGPSIHTDTNSVKTDTVEVASIRASVFKFAGVTS
jgi:hypothetical protein